MCDSRWLAQSSKQHRAAVTTCRHQLSHRLHVAILLQQLQRKQRPNSTISLLYRSSMIVWRLTLARKSGSKIWNARSQFRYQITARRTLVQSAVLSSVCPSVCLSVTLVDCDHIGWNSSKIISLSVSLGCLLFATQTSRVYLKGNTPKFLPEYGWKKWLSVYKNSNVWNAAR